MTEPEDDDFDTDDLIADQARRDRDRVFRRIRKSLENDQITEDDNDDQ